MYDDRVCEPSAWQKWAIISVKEFYQHQNILPLRDCVCKISTVFHWNFKSLIKLCCVSCPCLPAVAAVALVSFLVNDTRWTVELRNRHNNNNHNLLYFCFQRSYVRCVLARATIVSMCIACAIIHMKQTKSDAINEKKEKRGEKTVCLTQ